MFSEWAGPRTQRKTKEIIKTFMASKTHGPHRRNDKSEYQECTCKMDKCLNREIFNKFESRKICVAGYQCDNSDFDFCIAEHNELPVMKICSDEGRNDCQHLKPKGTQASFGTTMITVTTFIIQILFSRVSVNALVFVLRVVFYHLIHSVYCDTVHVRCCASGCCTISKCCVRMF